MAAKTTDWRPGPTVCRCCLSEGCYKDISTEYFWMGKREVYSEMLSDTFSLSIAYSTSGGPNSNSRLICEPCISRLRDASEFKRQVQECEKTFMQYLDPGSEPLSDFDDAVRVEAPMGAIDTQVKVEPVKLEKDEDSDAGDFEGRADFLDDDDDDLDDQPLTRLATKVPKKESVDLLELLDTGKTAEKRKSSTKAKAGPAKKAKTKKEVVKATSSKATKQTDKKKKGQSKTGVRKKILKRGLKTEDAEEKAWLHKKRQRASRDSAVALIHSANVHPFKYNGTFMCFYCQNKFTKMNELTRHVGNEHENVTEQDTRKAIARTASYQLIKVNVLNYDCELCSDDIANFEDLKHHLIDKHGKNIEIGNEGILPFKIKNNEYTCVYCDKIFGQYLTLSKHINVHYKFRCDQCKAGFATLWRLWNHVQSHDKGERTQTVVCEREKELLIEQKPKAVIFKKKRLEDIKRYNRESAITLIHSTNMIPFKYNGQFMCFYCQDQFLSMPELMLHVDMEHRDVSEIHIKKSFGRNGLGKPVKVNVLNYNCKLCNEELLHFEDLERHLIDKHEKYIELGNEGVIRYKITNDEFLCVLCGKDLEQYTALNKHINEHYAEFKCGQCGAAFATELRLRGHIFTHEEGCHPCDKCVRVFSKVASLNSHIRRVHMDRVSHNKCSHCEKSFRLYDEKRKHSLIAHGIKIPLRGNKGVEKPKPKVEYMDPAHLRLLDQQCQTSAKREGVIELVHSANVCPFKFHGVFLCLYCPNRFESMPQLVRHFKHEHKHVTVDDTRKAISGNRPLKINILDYSCRFCDDPISNFEDLKRHLVSAHNKRICLDSEFVMPYMVTEKEFICVVCDKRLEDYRSLSKHLNEHSKYICDQCGTGFASRLRLRRHLLIHEGGSHTCEECGKEFSNLMGKRQHLQLVHIRKKNVKCTQCSETFASYTQKRKHLITNHGVKPKERKCSFCPKVFYTTSNVRAHERRVHLIGMTKFTCDICNYKAFNKFRLECHMVSHTGVKNFKCEVCLKMYSSKKCLAEHMKIHYNVRNYVCQYCDKAFIQSASLKGHLRTHHKEFAV